MRSQSSGWIFLCVVCFSNVTAQAASGQRSARAAAASPVQELRKISVTATRGEREIDSIAGAVTVIDEEQIQRQLATDIKDLIRYEPGISVANSAARFGLAGFNIRGIDGNRVLIRIDDVRMSDAFSIGSFSDARRNLIDLDAIRQVEIIRGAASALYGSDAIGGVVSFVLKDPTDFLRDGRNTDFAMRSGYQSDDEGWFSGGRAAFGNQTVNGLVLYTHRAGHETDNKGEIGTLDRTRTEPNPQDYDSDSVLAKFGWNPHDNNRLKLTIEADRSAVDTNALSGVGVSGTVNTQSLRGDDEQQRARVSIGHEILAETAMFDSLNWLVYTQQTEIEQRTAEQRFTTTTGPASTLRRARKFDFDQSLVGGELIAHKDVALGSSEHRLTYGLDAVVTNTEQMRNGVQTTLATGVQTSNIAPDNFPVRDFPRTETRQYAVFAQDEIAFDDGAWLLVPGVRVDRYELDPQPDAIFIADNPGVAVTAIEETSVSPKLGLIRTFGDHLSAFAQYGRGFRAPPYGDANIGFTNLAFGYTAIANPDLQPETSDGYEVGLRGDFDAGYFEVAGFNNRYDDLIESLVPIGVVGGLQVYQSQNVAEARIYGVELRGGLDLATLSSGLAGWSVKSSVAWARGTNEVTDQPLNSVDPLKGVLGIAYEPADGVWGVELIGTAVDRKSQVNQSTGFLFVPPGYVTLDLLLHADIGERLRINAGIFNLTDRKYWDWTDVRGRAATDTTVDRATRPGLNASASATLRF